MRERQRKIVKVYTALLLLTSIISACGDGNTGSVESADAVKLPFIGAHETELRTLENGQTVVDTIYYKIPKFSFINQSGKETSHKDYQGKIFVADFFFTHCPSICPMLSAQMVRLQSMVEKGGYSNDVWFLSHTVDPTRDLPDTLLNYANNIGANLKNWNFVTGSADDIYYQAEQGYMLSAFPSDSADGGFFHTDKIALIDREMHIRGLYDGTSTKSVDKLYQDIQTLLLHGNDSAARGR
jgi:protein SCO1/2